MDKLYSAYIKIKIRKVIAEKDIPLERAIDFLKENPKTGVIIFNEKEQSLEELKNVKNFRSEDRIKSDIETSGGGPISESSDRELFSFIRNKTE